MPPAPIDLNQLRYFQAISRCGSLSAAARQLRISQPALTRAVRSLEDRLGATLLLRERTGVRLTDGGATLMRYADDVFSTLTKAELELQGLQSDEVGSFVIGCHESLGAYFLPGFMTELLDLVPRIEISLRSGTSANVERMVQERAVHFGLVVNARPQPNVVLQELFHDAVDVFAAADLSLSPGTSRLARRDGAELPADFAEVRAMLRAGPLLFAERIEQCRILIERLAERDLLPQKLFSCGDLELVKSLALAGLGVALLPRRVAAYGHEGRLRRLHPELPNYPDSIHLVTHIDLQQTRAVRILQEAFVRHGRRLDEQR